jgi:tetratricopeptide (TPR) repeat protein
MSDQKLKQNIFTSSRVPSGTTHPRRRPVQNYLLIWIDASIDQSSKDYQNTLAQLQNVVNDVNIFTEPDKCINFLTEIGDMKAFLIADDILGQQIISLIHDSPQLDAICILCENKSQHEEWTNRWSKIKGVHSEIKSICKTLKLAAKQCDDDSIAMSFVSVDEEASSGNLNQLEPSFMYTQIFKEILLEMKHDTQAIKDLAMYWRELYSGNVNQLKIIDEFERDYNPKTSIWWYTRVCFTFEILNQALRSLKGDTIINMGFFIHDLHRQIEELHKEQVGSYHGESFIVYRGQGLLTSDFEKLQKTQGGLMSFNNFLSTSKQRNVSLVFAEGTLTKTNTVGILFQMTIDPSVISTPYADIRGSSFFETEEEILFSMHSVFRIGKITKLEENNPLYQVDLKLTADDDEQLHTLTERIRNEVAGPTEWERMGKLLLNIGQFDEAEELYKVLLKQTSEEDKKAHYYNQLGYVKDDQGDYKEAIRYYEQGLEIKQRTLPQNDPLLATSYNNIGAAYRNMGEYPEALSFYEKALEIRQHVLPPNHPDMAQSYNNIGAVYENMGEYSNAFSFFEKALEIRQEILPPNHPDMAQSYNNMGAAYENMGEYSNALSFYEEAREIFEKTLPPNHPVLATSYNNIGEMYRNIGEYLKALSSHQKALEIRQTILPSNHPDMAQSYNNIGAVYVKMGEFSNALSFHQKTREIFENTLSPDHPSLAICYNNIGQVYRNMEEYLNALSFSEKALGILDKTVSLNHPISAACYNNIGLVYYDMKECSKALLYLDRALDIWQRSVSPNHPRLQCVQENIEMVKNNMK